MADEAKTLTNDELIQQFVAAVMAGKQEETHILEGEMLERMKNQKLEREKEALGDEYFEESHPMRGNFGGNGD